MPVTLFIEVLRMLRWKAMRKYDRARIGMARYPAVYYPEMYVLRGGYSQFFPAFPVVLFGWIFVYFCLITGIMRSTSVPQNERKSIQKRVAPL